MDNTTLPSGSGGDTIRTIDRSVDTPAIAAKTQVVALDVGGEAGPEQLVKSLAAETGGNLDMVVSLLTQILAELQVHSALLQAGLNVQDDVAVLRADILNNPSVQ